jgi:biopolymer transport protein TolR
MSLAAKRRPGAVPVMNVTPLVDVVLVLLIIFMVVIPMMDKIPHVTLPDLVNPDAEAKAKNDPFTLAIDTQGDLYFEQDKLSDAELELRLREANQADPTKRIVLRADRDTEYADVRRLFKICQGIGFPGISLRVNGLKTQDRN